MIFAGPPEISAALAPLAEQPDRAAACFDLDGTLAPIVARPEQAAVPARTVGLIERIADRYALTGVVSGRSALDARSILGLDSVLYIGNHGYELLEPGAERAQPAPALEGRGGEAAAFVAELDEQLLEAAGLRVEDKGAILALHWRGAEDEAEAERIATAVAAEAEAGGLATHRGRKVVEVRPRVEIDKGVGLAAVLEGSGIEAAFYAGDDSTDADAFRRLGELADAGELKAVVRVAVVSPETPAEVAEAADLAVEGPEAFVAVLEALA